MAAGLILIPAYMPAFDRDGDLISGARMYVYTNGTTELAPIYSNFSLTTPAMNPVIANSSGQFPSIYAEAGTDSVPVLYRVAFTDADGGSPGNPYIFDNYQPGTTGGGGGSVTWATQADIQAGVLAASAIAPNQAILGMPVVNRSIEQSTRPDPAIPNGVGGFANAFNGSQVANSVRVKSLLTGTALGSPATGYLYTEETAPVRIYYVNRSGHNEATDSNVGRTGGFAMRVSVTANQTVQGDSAAYSAAVAVGGAKPGATSFLANPGGVIINGDCVALNDGVFLNAQELNLIDNGYDVAGIAWVSNMARTNATGALGATWMGIRPQSTGTQAIDAFYSSRGKARIGLDFSTAEITGSAITLAADQTISFDSSNTSLNGFPRDTTLNDTYLKVSSVTGDYEFWRNGVLVGTVGAGGFSGGLAGNGSPEGVINAAPGMTYRQLDGANGSTLWAKRAGTGTTNWETLGSQPNRAVIAKAGVIISEGFLLTGLVGGNARRMTEYLSSGVLQIGDSAASYIALFNDLRPDGTRNIGDTAARWNNIYLVNAPNVSSDAREKTEEEFPAGLLREIKGLKMRAYKRNDGGKIRCGVFAQDVIACFDRAGVNWRDWDIVSEDENGALSVFYDHLFALKLAALEED